MNQSDFIAALVARFESTKPFPEAVWLAVGWLNSGTSIDEVRFLTLMTAIETIIDELTPDASSTTISKDRFAPVSEALCEVLGNFELSDTERDVLKGNIKGANRSPLSLKFDAVITEYNLPKETFKTSSFKKLNQQRNAIAHTGKPKGDIDLWECILEARELVALIVFAGLGYKGQYVCCAGGFQLRNTF